MVLTGLWTGRHSYKVLDPESGRSETVVIMGTDEEMDDPVNTDELAHWARERVAAGWATHQPKPELTKDQQHELGEALTTITASKRRRREVGHGRWWAGG